ncbi:RNA polymerase sigma factor [Streptomyces uncialis]|uniref:RNA polymerase sigma factor n=1 Tax=Streptomyces uncialis TaxID=1048205 RepID=UPI00378BA212
MIEEDDGPVVDAVMRVPLDFEAHYLTHQKKYHQYALEVLGTNDEAEKAVHRAFLEILRHWDALLTERNLQGQSWAIMRRVVISQCLRGKQKELASARSPLGLYSALSVLPARQFDAIVMRYAVECSTEEISWYMGITPSTVDHHCRRAKERLESALRRLIKQEDTT